MHQRPPPVRDVVLVGGGHSHVQVLRSLGMKPLYGARVTVISREVFTPYSGMLPGHVAGFYDWRDIHIDLGPLARFADARLVADEVVGLDLEAGRVELANHPSLRFDLLSLNTGAMPAQLDAAGQPVKPIGRFLPRWRDVRERAASGEQVVLVGGGAGGVELALAMRRVLESDVGVVLLTDELLPGQNRRAVSLLRRALTDSGVVVEEGFRAASVTPQAEAQLQVVTAADGRRVRADHLFWVTGVAAPAWIAASGLATDGQGFVSVDRHLRSVSHDRVFAAGDVAALMGQRRPKSGVFAVREGPVLADNLRRAVEGRRLRQYRAQRRFLAILGTGDGRAVASRGPWTVAGRWVWRWKDWIDRRFMRRFNELPEMAPPPDRLPDSLRAEAPDPMRCGGCGAKLGADPLRRVLARLPDQRRLEVRHQVRLGIGDDAALLHVERGELLLTVDGFRSIIDDPYRFGRITAHHSLNDVLAMGGRGVAALALATVPVMTEAMMEDELYQLLRGAVEVLNDHDVPLVGGHSAEGAELALALSITGATDARPLTKGGLGEGDALVITKPLGTGALLAGHMRARTPSDWLETALTAMDCSNAPALTILREHGLTALTDVTGFGLAGHLGEMLRASRAGAEIVLDQVPLLPGAARLVADGVVSSLQDNNAQALDDFELAGVDSRDARLRLLADPQTSGGLLAGIPAARVEACVQALQAAGYDGAARIGTVTADVWRIDGS